MATLCLVLLNKDDDWFLESFENRAIFVTTAGIVESPDGAPLLEDMMNAVGDMCDMLLDEMAESPQDFAAAESAIIAYGHNRELERQRRDRPKAPDIH